MTLLTDARNFFVREKKWGFLLLFLLAFYGGSYFWPAKRAERRPSEAVEKLRLAEIRLKQEIRSAGGVQKFLAEKPELLLIFNLFTLVLLGAVLLGLVIDFLWILWPRLRNRLARAHGPPEARPWTLGTIFKTILLFICLSLGLSIFLSFLRTSFLPHAGSNFWVLVHTTVSDIFCIALVIYFVHRLGGEWKDLGFRGVRFWKDLSVALAGYLAILPLFLLVLVGLALFAYYFAYEPPPHPLVEIFLEEEERAPALVAYSVFLACVAGPFFEEIFFRGFCYPAFKKRWGVGWALVLSSAFFGLIHQNAFAFLPIFVLGLGLGYLYEKRGTLVPSIALHIVHNTVFIAYFFLAKEVLTAT